ncbi:MAG: nucleotide sugar dehydrogenase [Chitinophagaceae bacterium]|nr:nucleotide sugar dehydrogenase [Chitinophagaceae bacterium]MBK7679010.1 nucleotide sugar dehydrogenase [Chitinophagaceae bacterium]MBK8299645.1 nucleotide sugar dehydrogenase [Chitinophagaceae bacterium]MBK9463696.1 nucleotide sugar dehydrogenase [Chitinophagaceae bacterium]MBK9937290.1 nucleotide sugar dehydrogenase [Chitinophagaceae bacterium]
MYKELIERKEKLAVIGLGYVGLPIALEFARQLSVIGFDINPKRIDMMKQGVDPSNELEKKDFEGCDITFTDSLDVLREAKFYIVAVPTPVDEHNVPDLTPVQKASETIGKVIKKGDYVVFESTVYPGCTEEDCLPIIEKLSGLKNIIDFKLGYSPERINPGDKNHTLATIVKVAAGCDAESLEEIAKTYELVVKAGVHRASSIKVAEAAKIIENTQRDLNIALMNELSIIFNMMNINTYEVLEAAGTKWNFLKFQPGLVGGHCIGVDPYYLTYKAREMGYDAEVILAGRNINDNMAKYVATAVVQHIIKNSGDVKSAKVLIKGATFKENVSDIRNSKVADVVKALKSYYVNVDVEDPHADSDELQHEYGFGLVAKTGNDYDAVIITVPHNDYKELGDDYFASITKSHGMIADLKGIYRNRITNRTYWSL